MPHIPILHLKPPQIQPLLRLLKRPQIDTKKLVFRPRDLVGPLPKHLHAALIAEVQVDVLKLGLVVWEGGL